MTSNKRSLDARRPPHAYLFHSGLCSMFRTLKEPRQRRRHSKTDACALACCGIWLWQRNKFLLTGEKPKRWKDKPLETSIVILLIATAIVWSLDPRNAALPLLLLVIMGCFLWKLFEFQYSRSIFREQLAIQEYIRQKKEVESEASEEDGTRTKKQVVYLTNEHNIIDPHNDPELIQFLSQRHKREVYGDGAHALCGCANSQLNPINFGDDDGEEGGDCCLSLWALLANSCCGWLCRCYCQLCGMCAIAQEHRYLTEVLPEDPTLWQRDYVTLQSWQDYYPAIVRLRVAGKMNFFSHLRAMSALSYRLIVTAAASLLFVTLVTLLPVHFPRWQIFVLYGTLFQPLLILFFVYWLWHRLDISLDAVVKYFAAGFFICTGISVLYEMMVSMLASIAIYLISMLEAIGMILVGAIDLDDVLKDDDEIGDRDSSLPIAYSLSIALTTAFLNAFFVAALVEELVKYLCFWMVEHPDLEPDGVLLSTEFSKGAEQVADVVGTDTSKLSMRGGNTHSEIPTEFIAPTCSYVSWGASITVAMVTTALGFACAENLLYVFVYTPHGINEEVSTLMVRCLFPIHPLAAALQSLGVCRRELECQSQIQVGRIVFPAWLLHGSFDFSLMAYSLITQVLSTTSDDHSTMAPSSFESDGAKFLVVSCVMIAPIWAVVFYFKEAWEQRDRLEALDKQHR